MDVYMDVCVYVCMFVCIMYVCIYSVFLVPKYRQYLCTLSLPVFFNAGAYWRVLEVQESKASQIAHAAGAQ